MTEEIKEILKYIDQFVYVDQSYNDIKLSKIDTKLILDYITNLQQENEKLKYNARGQVNDYFKDKYADEVLKNAELTKENERLKGYKDFYKGLLNQSEDNIKELIKKLKDYKSICEKAIEYIKENYPTSTINYQDDKYKLINILNGSDENEN